MKKSLKRMISEKLSVLLSLSLMFSFAVPAGLPGKEGGTEAVASVSNATENGIPADGPVLLKGPEETSYRLDVANKTNGVYTYDLSQMLPSNRQSSSTVYSLDDGAWLSKDNGITASYGSKDSCSITENILTVSVKAGNEPDGTQIGNITIVMKETASASDVGDFATLKIYAVSKTEHSITVKNDYSSEYSLTVTPESALAGETVLVSITLPKPSIVTACYSYTFLASGSDATAGVPTYFQSSLFTMPDADVTVTVLRQTGISVVASIVSDPVLLTDPNVLQQAIGTVRNMSDEEQAGVSKESISNMNQQIIKNVNSGSGGISNDPSGNDSFSSQLSGNMSGTGSLNYGSGPGSVASVQADGQYLAAGVNADTSVSAVKKASGEGMPIASGNLFRIEGSATDGRSVLQTVSGQTAAAYGGSPAAQTCLLSLISGGSNNQSGLNRTALNISSAKSRSPAAESLQSGTGTVSGALSAGSPEPSLEDRLAELNIRSVSSGSTRIITAPKNSLNSVTVDLLVNGTAVRIQSPLILTLTFTKPLTGKELLIGTEETASGYVNKLIPYESVNEYSIRALSRYSTFTLLRKVPDETADDTADNTGQDSGDSGSESGSSAILRGRWIRAGTGWRYQYEDGNYAKNSWKYLDGRWYHFDSEGFMQTGWILVGGNWYYLLPESGCMAVGYIRCPDGHSYFMKEDGAMATGDIRADGSIRHFNPDLPPEPTYSEDPATHIWKPNGSSELPLGAEKS